MAKLIRKAGTPKTPSTVKIVNQDITLVTPSRLKPEIMGWRAALSAAESSLNPYRALLYQYYNELWIDVWFRALAEKLIRTIKNSTVVYRNADGVIDEIFGREYLETHWFVNLAEIFAETFFWGHSLVELLTEGGKVIGVKLVPRHMVRPELGIVCRNSPQDQDGIRYREEDMVAAHTLEISFGLGVMNIAAANVIYFRAGKADYANYAERYGSPIAEIRYDAKYPGAKAQAEQAGKDLGNSNVAILPIDSASFSLHDAGGGTYSGLHRDMLEMLKDELSVLILGGTMTAKDGSSYSQSEIHREEQEQVTKEKMKEWIFFLNEIFKPKIVGLGAVLDDGGRFELVEQSRLSLREKLDIDLAVSEKIQIDPEHWYSTYGLPKAPSEKKKLKPAT